MFAVIFTVFTLSGIAFCVTKHRVAGAVCFVLAALYVLFRLTGDIPA